ncbi:MAG TPA: MFS transporter [Candidatus Blautia gallistercoris]|uniref:MFS transporter n=1 Tax=Candidatus Blautia gallistercoris TaxID=2838490 RepID=A0A9D1WHG8_9FIRM|nr:MFS transporter [Candidatus Blautia gallistercoris]
MSTMGGCQPAPAAETNWQFQFRRIVILSAIVLIYFLQGEIRFLPSPLMEDLAADFAVPLTTVGNLLSLCMVAAAISMFGVSVVVEKVGSVNMLIISAVCVAVSGCVSFAARNFAVILLAYLFCGICQGIMECIGVVLVAQLFSSNYRALFCSLICAVSQITSSIAYSLPVFLEEPLGGWRHLELLWGILAVGVAVLVFFFGGRKMLEKAQEKKQGAEKIGLLGALRMRFIVLSVLTMVVFIWVNNHYAIYLPTYLAEVKGFSKEQAGLGTSLMYICGFIGALVSGALSVKFRKSIYRYTPMFMLAGSLILCLFQTPFLVLLGAGLFACAYQMWIPMALASFMNLDGVSTAVLAGATALFNGSGHFLTGFIPTVFTWELQFMSMHTAYLITSCLLLISVVLVLAASSLKEFQ